MVVIEVVRAHIKKKTFKFCVLASTCRGIVKSKVGRESSEKKNSEIEEEVNLKNALYHTYYFVEHIFLFSFLA